MPTLTSITLDDGTTIWIEATEGVNGPLIESPEGPTRGSKGWGSDQVQQNFVAMQQTIRGYTAYTLNAFRQMAGAKVDKVTLEFGIELGGEMGVPYVTKGTAASNLKVTVECSFPEKEGD